VYKRQGLEDPDGCDSCHDDDLVVDGERCLVCHDLIAARVAAGKGVHREVTAADCAMCHVEHQGRDADLRGFDTTGFDHAGETGFALEGFHGEFAGDCSRCHATRSFLTLSTECSHCHQDAHRGTLGDDCTQCHATDAHFRSASRAFHKSGLFRLEGRHLAVPCADCHWNQQIKGTPTRCADCHWIRRQDTPHRTLFGLDCENCHQPISWTDVNWDHAAHTGFDNGGQHRTVDCTGCHPGWRFDGTASPDCYSCHGEDYRGADDPNHVAAGFPTQCDVCHRPSDSSWRQATFEHPYRLLGQHATLVCADCHADGIYAGTPTDCVGCHRDDYDSAENPDHVAAGFPTNCRLCHDRVDSSWQDADFAHPYTLVGVHATLECSDCHAGGVYVGTPTECVGCHRSDYDGSRDPNHPAAGFPTDCESCHSQSDPNWHQADYPHTAWPLVASHSSQRCIACHTGEVYAGLPSDCVDCHIEDYNATDDPNHPAAGFPTTCATCHTPTDWDDADFDHLFPLVGVHSTLECSACHSSGIYEGLPSDCVDCHIADYEDTTDPNHGAAGFPTDCQNCHDPSDGSWEDGDGSGFDHAYSLVGAHATLNCSDCHSSGVYEGLPSDCVDCHIDDYNDTTDPNHPAAGFPTTCETCHAPTSWGDADFTHSYSLVGVHATLDCSDCHSSGVYEGLPSDCVDCHIADYEGARNPNHVTNGFPTDCTLCHRPSDASWNDGTFDHPFFPITSGPHASADCSDCHIEPGNFAVFSCLDAGCHPQSRMDDKHSDEPGYVYDSAACYSCHPDGRPPGDRIISRMRASHD
jgi:hypothetical protein